MVRRERSRPPLRPNFRSRSPRSPSIERQPMHARERQEVLSSSPADGSSSDKTFVNKCWFSAQRNSSTYTYDMSAIIAEQPPRHTAEEAHHPKESFFRKYIWTYRS